VLHRKEGDEKEDDEKKKNGGYFREGYPVSFWERFWWVTKIVVSFRFICVDTRDGKVREVDGAESEKVSRIQWLLWKGLVIAGCILALDGTTSYSLFDPYFLDEASIDTLLPAFLPAHTFLSTSPRLFRLGVLFMQHYAMLEISHAMPAFIFVALGGMGVVGDWWGNPSDWPPVMGDLRVVLKSGLRGFWGRFWHQLFRNVGVSFPTLKAFSTRLIKKDFPRSRKSLSTRFKRPSKINS